MVLAVTLQQAITQEREFPSCAGNTSPTCRSRDNASSTVSPESRIARALVDDALQRAEGRIDPAQVRDEHITEPGSRYIDFLIPGLLGFNLMQSGLWGVGFVIVEMRVRKAA